MNLFIEAHRRDSKNAGFAHFQALGDERQYGNPANWLLAALQKLRSRLQRQALRLLAASGEYCRCGCRFSLILKTRRAVIRLGREMGIAETECPSVWDFDRPATLRPIRN